MEVRCSDTETRKGGVECDRYNKCRFSLAIGSGIAMGNGDKKCHGFLQRVQETMAYNYTAVTFGRSGGTSHYLEKAIEIGSQSEVGQGQFYLWARYSHMRYKWDERYNLIPSIALVSFSLLSEFV